MVENILTIAEMTESLAEQLCQRAWFLTTAESCTGGLFAQTMTTRPGSSAYFDRGFICYSNAAKVEMLDVPRDILQQYGAVSIETAAAMAKGALQNSHAQISISTTGIAGPSGGSVEKPVGTVCFGVSFYDNKDIKTYTFNELFTGNRQEICLSSVAFGLKQLLKVMELVKSSS